MCKYPPYIPNEGSFPYESKNDDLSKSENIRIARLHQIEKLIGVSITQNINEVLEQKSSEILEIHNQTIQLLKAFDLIRDVEARNNIIAFVLAAAQYEAGHN